MSSELSIGAASTIVTPPLGCQMAGFDARKGVAEKVHDDLHSRALVLGDGHTRIALVSVEVLGVSKPFADRVRSEVESRTGIAAANVIISATHTHCGPATFNHFFNQGQPLDDAYLDQLANGIIESVANAVDACRPRRLRAGMVRVNEIAVNRRTADGLPVDPAAGVLVAEDLDGTIAAIIINYPCHTTVLGPNTLAITADFPYYTIQRLREQFGAGTEILYFNGAEGDLSMGHRSDLSAVGVIAPNRTFEKAEELGVRLADAVSTQLDALEYQEAQLRILRRTVALPLKLYAPLPEMTAERERAGRELDRLEKATQTEQSELLRVRQRSLFSRIEEYYAILYEQEPGTAPKTVAGELTAVLIGNTALLSLPGEVFVEIALAIRGQSRFGQTMFLGLANDYIGYVPTAGANASSGYEVVAARVAQEAAAVLENEAVGLLAELHS